MNSLEPGNGGPVSAPEPATNSLEVKPRARPESEMMKHFGDQTDQAAARFAKMKEAKQQIDAVMATFGKLAGMLDTVTTKDVVSGCANIVAAGVSAVQMATILADMPEQPEPLQAWIKDEFQKAQEAEAKINEGLDITRHGLLTNALQSLIAHSAESQQLAQMPVMGNA